jgi:hypothetical protein
MDSKGGGQRALGKGGDTGRACQVAYVFSDGIEVLVVALTTGVQIWCVTFQAHDDSVAFDQQQLIDLLLSMLIFLPFCASGLLMARGSCTSLLSAGKALHNSCKEFSDNFSTVYSN